ncbi:hypothetical protein [Nitratireductor sp. CH_MIT9313-5]|uniref:hypothetical protein n=1 Tax=Nitratireductor sp. CH_MIT9313-5 TaxID=3107764 RepID=UPI00300A5CC8
MNQKTKATRVRLRCKGPVEIDVNPTITLPPGTYEAEAKQFGVPTLGGRISWTDPEYLIELSGDQIQQYGGKPNATPLISAEYDVTQFVKKGVLTLD